MDKSSFVLFWLMLHKNSCQPRAMPVLWSGAWTTIRNPGWMEREEILFRTLEKHLLGDQLRKGFAEDVDGFIAFSLSVQNRRALPRQP
jgi:hypothetical protein